MKAILRLQPHSFLFAKDTVATSGGTEGAYCRSWFYDRQMCFAQKIALVTGAASGIGKAVVTELVQRKASVFAADIDSERVRALATQLSNTTALTLDVTEESAALGNSLSSRSITWMHSFQPPASLTQRLRLTCSLKLPHFR